jgi:hypothetical protein
MIRVGETQRWNRSGFSTTGTGFCRSDRIGLIGLKLESAACRYRLDHWVVIFDIVNFQQEFITHLLREYKSRKVNKVDR